MADVFLSDEVGELLKGQHVVVLGGSFMRGIYKDIIWVLNHNSLIPREILGAKGEKNFPDLENTTWKERRPDPELGKIFTCENRDSLLEYEGLTAGRDYIEPRKYYNKKYNVTFVYMFVARMYNEDLSDFLTGYEEKEGAPINTLIMNSCHWDINRWGPRGPQEYESNAELLKDLLATRLPGADVLWLTCPVGAEEMNSKGMNVPGLEFQCFTARYNIIEANRVSSLVMSRAGHSVIDLHYYLQFQTFRRNADGIHWDPEANRLVTNLILTHLTLLRKGPVALPGRATETYALELLKLRHKISKNEDKSTAQDVESKLRALQSLPVAQFYTAEENNNSSIKDAFKEKVGRTLSGLRQKERDRSRREEYLQKVSTYIPLRDQRLLRAHPYAQDRPPQPNYGAPFLGGNPQPAMMMMPDSGNLAMGCGSYLEENYVHRPALLDNRDGLDFASDNTSGVSGMQDFSSNGMAVGGGSHGYDASAAMLRQHGHSNFHDNNPAFGSLVDFFQPMLFSGIGGGWSDEGHFPVWDNNMFSMMQQQAFTMPNLMLTAQQAAYLSGEYEQRQHVGSMHGRGFGRGSRVRRR